MLGAKDCERSCARLHNTINGCDTARGTPRDVQRTHPSWLLDGCRRFQIDAVLVCQAKQPFRGDERTAVIEDQTFGVAGLMDVTVVVEQSHWRVFKVAWCEELIAKGGAVVRVNV